jgi:hypothetical protein
MAGDVVVSGEALAKLSPGPELMAHLRRLDVASLDLDDRIEVVAAWERQAAWVAAQTQAALATINADIAQLPAADRELEVASRAAQVAVACGWSPRSGMRRIATAEHLVGALPRMFGLLAEGQVSARHALALAEATLDLQPVEAAAVEAAVADRAVHVPVARFARLVEHTLATVLPELAAERHVAAVAGRGVRLSPLPDGMACLSAVLPASDATSVYAALDAHARRQRAADPSVTRGVTAFGSDSSGGDGAGPGDGADAVGIDALRADALVSWARRALADPEVAAYRRRAEVQVVIDLPSLLGLADRPAELLGYGPVPAVLARELAADANWRRLVVDPVDGHLLDFGTETYRPPKALVDYIHARDRHCRFPGCRTAAADCDIDHTIAAPHDRGSPGGPTAASNTADLCRRHHRLKTYTQWRYVLRENADAEWTSPTGRVYVQRATSQYDTW